MRCTMKNQATMLAPSVFKPVHPPSLTYIMQKNKPHQKGDYLIDLKGDVRLRLSQSYK
ncbi:hypothetical protein [Thalassomonas haliotis]|uniref:Uncharacterized protein n=1 Tax=Thalassomonas haliotis TaxID=485448 RepID=A0ABY7VG66_9GAMM|nr:hypothetical protein [Thalassomonas haliotis]WDE12412.1 hypothetical protein H3N35_02695 [Thalassomonas haliotis]